MKKKDTFLLLERVARDAGACSFGVASVERMRLNSAASPPSEELARFPYAVCVGCRLSDSIMDSLTNGPSRLYAYHYRVVNRELDRIALRVANEIQRIGYDACPVPSSQIIDWRENVGHTSHRWAAYHAGLGWYGRNNLIISPEHGARVRYVTVYTDVLLPTSEPVDQDCGECRACVCVCPAGAISERREDFDLGKCEEQLRFFRNKWNIGHHICGLCIKACAGRKRAKEAGAADKG
jgi:epoxyqueuosine reductase